MSKFKKKPLILIGTSGWSYSHWKTNFYPQQLKSIDWLSYYSQTFNTVEINTTFYHTPKESTIMKWDAAVPENFLFSLKASRYITHQKKLNDCKESLEFFFKNIQKLKSKVGPILFQLPPSFQINVDRLTEFINLLDMEYDYVFEFRHSSWFNNEIYEILSKNNIALASQI